VDSVGTVSSQAHAKVGQGALVIGALGVVYGDIGTSPLYSFKETFTEHTHELRVDQINVYGVCSLAFWALILIISVKYLYFVMKADNHGEGGILALTSLVMKKNQKVVKASALVTLGVFGTALLYGDGIITPAISVLSAVEGLEEVSSSFEAWVIPIAVAILVGLFSVQKRGTGAVGKVFGPIMVVWFVVIAIMGVRHIFDHPGIIESVNPIWAVRFFENESMKAFLALGSIFLVVTGGEALYADMGHFGRKPIAIGWYSLVLPALVLNYWGQGAFVLENPELVNPDTKFFFLMVPEPLKLPLVILATMATIIASQALISGVFSLTQQAVQLDYLPRIRIDHTSHQHSGQIYVPLVNWALMVACVGLVIGFQTSSNLAAAYGIAVTMTMAITTLIFFRVLTDRWGWARWKAMLVCVPMLVAEFGFLGANIPKIPHGGWFALGIGGILMVQMSTWRRGRQLVAARIRRGERPSTRCSTSTTTSSGSAARVCSCSRTSARRRPRWSTTCATTRCSTARRSSSASTPATPRESTRRSGRWSPRWSPACSKCCSPTASWKTPMCRRRWVSSRCAASRSTRMTSPTSSVASLWWRARRRVCTQRSSISSCGSTVAPTAQCASSTCPMSRSSKSGRASRSDDARAMPFGRRLR
jgi:KUP system potassium uptake protein